MFGLKLVHKKKPMTLSVVQKRSLSHEFLMEIERFLINHQEVDLAGTDSTPSIIYVSGEEGLSPFRRACFYLEFGEWDRAVDVLRNYRTTGRYSFDGVESPKLYASCLAKKMGDAEHAVLSGHSRKD